MKYNYLGNTGLQISNVSYGTWATFGTNMSYNESKKCIDYCYNNGINYFDSAESYAGGQAEVLLGKIIKELKIKRETIMLSSKYFFGLTDNVNTKRTLNRKYIINALDNSLFRYNSDYLDLVYCHRYDEKTGIEEIASTMNDLIVQGKIIYWGTSEWPINKLEELLITCDKLNLRKPITEQYEYNLFNKKIHNYEFVE